MKFVNKTRKMMIKFVCIKDFFLKLRRSTETTWDYEIIWKWLNLQQDELFSVCSFTVFYGNMISCTVRKSALSTVFSKGKLLNRETIISDALLTTNNRANFILMRSDVFEANNVRHICMIVWKRRKLFL